MAFKILITAVCTSFFLALVVAGDQPKLEMETIKEGDCTRRAKNGDNLKMHYDGTLMDGKQFDSSYSRGEPFGFQLGQGMVIKGWEQGLLGMCKGEIRNLVIPSHLAYGDNGYPPVIPAKATLKFKVELLGWDDETGEKEL